MIGKVKDFLGIESVKIDLELPEKFSCDEELLIGKIILTSKSKQKVKSITIKLIEKYIRGRRKNKLVNEYTAGILEFSKPFIIYPDKEIAFEFKLPYRIEKSEMDRLGSHNFITKSFVKVAKLINNVSSTFRVEASAKVQGNAISPFVKKEIKSY